MKIIISDLEHETHEEEKSVFEPAGLSFEVKQAKTEDSVIELCKGAEVLLTQYAPITEKAIAALAPKLKAIIRYGVGLDNIDVEAAGRFNVQVCNVPDYGMNEVAEHALALALALARKIPLMDREVRAGEWRYQTAAPIHRLADQTLGVIGFGRNGQAFAKKASGIFKKIIAYSPSLAAGKYKDCGFAEPASFDNVLANSDILALHLPLTTQTKHLINKESLGKMKKGAFLVNVSRGALINEKDLEEALANKTIAGAALDVFEEEPIKKDSPLLKFPNIIFSPHIAWHSEEAQRELKLKTAQEALRFIKGEKLRNPVNTVKR